MSAALIDAHCHLDFPELAQQLPDIFTKMDAAAIERIVIPAVRRRDWQRVLDVAALDARLSPCLGIHPWFVGEHDESDVAALEQWLQRNPQCVALGECGLDKVHGEVAGQMPLFEAQVELAAQRAWPLVIHSVHTHEPVMKALGRQDLQAGVLIHAFAGSPEQARQLAQKGLFLGVGGIITFARARKTRQAIAQAPLGCLVLETDAPDMPQDGVAKGANTPLNLPRIFQALCELRPETPEAIAKALRENTRQLYRW